MAAHSCIMHSSHTAMIPIRCRPTLNVGLPGSLHLEPCDVQDSHNMYGAITYHFRAGTVGTSRGSAIKWPQY